METARDGGPGTDGGGGLAEDLPADELDDEGHREELRQRHYGLLQELRVLLPGVQVLAAFLLTVPFAQKFSQLDDLGQALYGVTLVSAMLAVVAFMTPTALHRFGDRRARAERLSVSITATRCGFPLLGIALLSGTLVVTRFVFGTLPAVLMTGAVAAAMVLAWVVLPFRVRERVDARLEPEPGRDLGEGVEQEVG